MKVSSVAAVEILDSRSRPTLATTITLGDGTIARAGVPSWRVHRISRSGGTRDHDPHRFGGGGVMGAVAAVNGEIANPIEGRTFEDLAGLDRALTALDGTDNKSRLDANAMVGMSVAAARALAVSQGYLSGGPCSPLVYLHGCRCPTSTSSTEVSMPRITSTSRVHGRSARCADHG